jgi:hypothetical protein
MRRYFPSRKVFVVGVLAIALLAWAIVYQGTSQQNSAIKDTAPITVAQADSVFPDSDNDGLYDWEEALYETDPNNPDSDGDGVQDGVQFESENKPLNVRLSDSVFAAVNRLGEDAQNIPNPIDLLSTEPPTFEEPYGTYNLTLVEDSDEHKDSYITEVFVALSKHGPILEEDPLAVAGEYLQSKNPATLERIQEMNEETMEIAHSLLLIEVPKHYADTHLDIANNLYLSGLSLQDIEKTNADPMAGFFASANYTNYQSKYLDAVNSLISNSNNE